MALNNALLYNAAQAGFSVGFYSQSAVVGSLPGAPYSVIAAAAATFAAQLDALIPPDSSITGASSASGAAYAAIPASNGQALLPSSSAVVAAQLGKSQLLQSICAAKTAAHAVGAENPNNLSGDVLAILAQDVAAAYQAGQATLVTP